MRSLRRSLKRSLAKVISVRLRNWVWTAAFRIAAGILKRRPDPALAQAPTHDDEPYAIPDPKNDGAWTVGPGHVFVMGDNRPNPNDSDYSMGQIPIGDIEGQVLRGETPVHDPLPAPPAPAVEVSW